MYREKNIFTKSDGVVKWYISAKSLYFLGKHNFVWKGSVEEERERFPVNYKKQWIAISVLANFLILYFCVIL